MSNSYKYDWTTTLPARPEELRDARPRSEIHYEPQPADEAVGVVEILAHLLVGVVIFTAMWRSEFAVPRALFAAIAYFGVTTVLRHLLKTNTVRDVWRAWLDFRLERQRLGALERLAHRQMDLNEVPRSSMQAPALPAEGLPGPSPKNFVEPYLPEDIALAVRWAESLYSDDGYLLRSAVGPDGRVKGRLIGSKRDETGTPAAQQYLVDRGFLDLNERGAFVVAHKFPNAMSLSLLR